MTVSVIVAIVLGALFIGANLVEYGAWLERRERGSAEALGEHRID